MLSLVQLITGAGHPAAAAGIAVPAYVVYFILLALGVSFMVGAYLIGKNFASMKASRTETGIYATSVSSTGVKQSGSQPSRAARVAEAQAQAQAAQAAHKGEAAGPEV